MFRRYKNRQRRGFKPFLILLLLLVSLGYAQKLSYDYGDAPDKPYPTLNINNGARHLINYSVYLGKKIDADADGQPNSGANGDDSDGTDDEDGVSFTSQLVPGNTANIVVKASINGMLNAWIDFNNDDDWDDTNEQIFTDKALTSGNNNLSFSVPNNAKIGYTYARFRFSINGKLRYAGSAPDGEVEDYRVKIKELVEYDFGDAPDKPYPTKLSSTGARHLINPDVFLGILIDDEMDGQASLDAKGDDSNGLDDEDGVLFSSALTAGAWATADVTASVSGFLNAWIDFNNNGNWADAGEQIFTDQLLSGGVNSISFIVPGSSSIGSTFARFRFSTVNGLSYMGDAEDGEVEDYQVDIRERGEPVPPIELDVFELAWLELEIVMPDGSSEAVMLTGPVEQVVYFEGAVEGSAVDDDGDGHDEINTEIVSMDLNGSSPTLGIVHASLNTEIVSFGQIREKINKIEGTLDIPPFTPQGTADSFFDVFFDITIDGTHFLTMVPKRLLGVIRYKPPGPGERYEDCERIELLDADGNPTGYLIRCIEFRPTPEFDFGDAPDPKYPTLRVNNGPYHIVTGRLHLGSSYDAEINGQPDPNALGDDSNGYDDEDGVVFSTALVPGTSVNFNVTAANSSSVNAYFNAWIDFNGNSDWSDPGEHVFVDQVLASGSHTLTLSVPTTAVPGLTFARFRYSIMDSLSFIGYGGIGEVEDYEIAIIEKEVYPWKWLQPPTYYSDSHCPKCFWGWDEKSVYKNQILADDWCCEDSSPVTDIHWWGSYLEWEKDEPPTNAPESFHIGIWKDVPKGVDMEFSHPGELIKEWNVKRDNLNEKVAGSDFHPDFMEKPDLCFRYDFYIPEKDWFYQEGDSTIYWISIAAVYKEIPDKYMWGWKTRDHYFNDDAVRILGPVDPTVGSKFDKGEPVKDLKGISWDMAFGLTTIITKAKHDLGDAPDRSNTFSSTMTAYPGVKANFPTVYSAGSPPYGPIHWNPKDIAFLGKNVTLENEADIGLDEDPKNNIDPPNNNPDLDLADEGVNVPLFLPHCKFAEFDYTVTVVNPVSDLFSLNAWIDWNRDGDWNDTLKCNDQILYEWVVQNKAVIVNTAGTFTYTTDKFLCWHPGGEKDTSAVWMRVTLSDKRWDPKKNIDGGAGPAEGWKYGETEDYYFTPFHEEFEYDCGDAPDSPYPTLMINGGAYHQIDPVIYLGDKIDPDSDGQPDAVAQGDDLLDGIDDEDGVVFNSTLFPGGAVDLTVTASVKGYLNAWIDFNSDGDWDDPYEQIFNDYVLNPGANNLSFNVPDYAVIDTTFSRFRFSRQEGLSYTGFAINGEVEDYMIFVYETGVENRSSEDILPSDYKLSQNFPNPFNSFTEIRYELPKKVDVRLVIINMRGQEISVLVDEQKEAGRYSIRWGGKDQTGRTVPTGIYLYRIRAGDFIVTKKMLILK